LNDDLDLDFPLFSDPADVAHLDSAGSPGQAEPPSEGPVREVIDSSGAVVIDEDPYAEADAWVLLPPDQAVPVTDLDNPVPAAPPAGIMDTYSYLDDNNEVQTKTVWRPLQPEGVVLDPDADLDSLAEHVDDDTYAALEASLATGSAVRLTTDAAAITRSDE